MYGEKNNLMIKDYTYFSSPHATYSRIDYFLMFKKDKHWVKKCHIGCMDVSDHCPVYMSVKIGTTLKETLWKLNSSILNKDTAEHLTNEIEEYLKFNDNGEVSPTVLWDACKVVMRGKLIAMTSLLKKRRKENLDKLQNELKILEQQHKNSLNSNIKIEMKMKNMKYMHRKLKKM